MVISCYISTITNLVTLVINQQMAILGAPVHLVYEVKGLFAGHGHGPPQIATWGDCVDLVLAHGPQKRGGLSTELGYLRTS